MYSLNPLVIWCNMSLSGDAKQALLRGSEGHKLTLSDRSQLSNLVPGTPEASARDADVLLGQPDPADIIESQRVRWVHLSTAGYTRYDRDDVRSALGGRGGALTNSSAVYADPCAQHVLAFMLAHSRRLLVAEGARREARWDYESLRPAARVLGGQRVLIAGLGAIGRRLAELLAPFGADIVAVRRSPRGDEPVRTEPMDRLDELLSAADHVANVLPSAKQTARLFNSQRFGAMKPGAAFYNVGRGDTVDQSALRASLESGRLSAAYLDVTSPEPLPPSDPLWSTPNCYITPHIAGGAQDEALKLVEHFTANLRRFEAGNKLADQVI